MMLRLKIYNCFNFEKLYNYKNRIKYDFKFCNVIFEYIYFNDDV